MSQTLNSAMAVIGIDTGKKVRVGPRANLAIIDRSAHTRAVPLAIQEAGDRPA
jgi:hypothetical protein